VLYEYFCKQGFLAECKPQGRSGLGFSESSCSLLLKVGLRPQFHWLVNAVVGQVRVQLKANIASADKVER